MRLKIAHGLIVEINLSIKFPVRLAIDRIQPANWAYKSFLSFLKDANYNVQWLKKMVPKHFPIVFLRIRNDSLWRHICIRIHGQTSPHCYFVVIVGDDDSFFLLSLLILLLLLVLPLRG